MAILNPPAYLQAGTYPASSDRLHQTSARFIPTTLSTSDVAARGGVLPGQAARNFSSSMTNWDVTIGKGVAVVENTFTAQGGDYEALNTASQVLTVTASSPTTNRIDIIGIRIQDAFYTGAINSGDLAVVQGAAVAGTPADPALPSSFLPLWRVTVNAGTTTGILADLRKRTNIMGAVYQPLTNQLADVGTVVGEVQILGAAGVYPARMRVWDGSAWRGVTPFVFDRPAQAGSGTLPVGGSGSVIASVSVPDPGYAYKIKGAGSLSWAVIAASSPGNLLQGSVTLDSTTYNVGVISGAYEVSESLGAGFSQPSCAVPLGATAAQAAGSAHTVRLIARNTGGTNMTLPVDAFGTYLTVEVVPA